jgi:hypothetical protein
MTANNEMKGRVDLEIDGMRCANPNGKSSCLGIQLLMLEHESSKLASS